MSQPPVTAVHTGAESCPVRPLHDPCHTGSSEDGRTLDDMTVRSVLYAWRRQIRGTASGQGEHALYSQEALDAAAAELARQGHGGAADPDDIRLASDVLSAAMSRSRGQETSRVPARSPFPPEPGITAGELFTLQPGDLFTIIWSGEHRMVTCDRITSGGAVIRELTEAEQDDLDRQAYADFETRRREVTP